MKNFIFISALCATNSHLLFAADLTNLQKPNVFNYSFIEGGFLHRETSGNGININASFDKASEENERNYVKIKSTNGDELILVQIAGLIARRIVCEIKEKDKIKQGDKFGIIKFGSRVDLYFENYQLLVQQNQKTIAGETLIAKKL